MLRTRFTLFLCAFILLFCNLASLAVSQEPLYQIELIVFSHITDEGLQSEYWPILPPLVTPSNAIELTSEQIVPAKDWLLKSAQQLLEKNNHIILLHLAWQETAAAARQAHTIHLVGGESYDDHLRQLNGVLSIRLERYFSVHLNLQFLLPWVNISGMDLKNIHHDEKNPYIVFNINERLRMRSNELNYIDHPLYGVLIKIIPLSQAQS